MPITDVDPERLRKVCERYDVVRLDAFGSLARGTANAESDIDLVNRSGNLARYRR